LDKAVNQKAIMSALNKVQAAQQEAHELKDGAVQRRAKAEEQQQRNVVLEEAHTNLAMKCEQTETQLMEQSGHVAVLKQKISSKDANFADYKQKAESLQASLLQEVKTLQQDEDLHDKVLDLELKMEALGDEKQELTIRNEILAEETQIMSAQNNKLIGHTNLKQKIHLHAKVKEENHVLKLENIRIANAYKALKRANVRSGIVSEPAASKGVKCENPSSVMWKTKKTRWHPSRAISKTLLLLFVRRR